MQSICFFCCVSPQSPSGDIDRARLRKILIGTGVGLASTHDVDTFMRLLPQGSAVSFQNVAEVYAAASACLLAHGVCHNDFQALTGPTIVQEASQASERRETFALA